MYAEDDKIGRSFFMRLKSIWQTSGEKHGMRRLAFEQGTEAFRASWAEADARLALDNVRAKEHLPRVAFRGTHPGRRFVLPDPRKGGSVQGSRMLHAGDSPADLSVIGTLRAAAPLSADARRQRVSFAPVGRHPAAQALPQNRSFPDDDRGFECVHADQRSHVRHQGDRGSLVRGPLPAAG
jgi:hypothetical protein